MPQVAIVVDLGFGDAGKGLLTDFLVRRMGAATVVRFNGGAQAGHNVVTADGRHHTFSQLGAGSFVPDVRTFLSRQVVVDPLALEVEAQVLAGKLGEDPLQRLAVDRDARIITPFHRAMNRLRERLRGQGAHGSCGVGFGETVQDSLEHPEDTVRFGMLLGDPRAVLERVRERKRAECKALLRSHHASRAEDDSAGDAAALAEEELALFEDPTLVTRWLEKVRAVARQVRVADASTLASWLREGPAVFEGAQGVLLDERFGFAPHTTWSDCTFAPALALLGETGAAVEPIRYGVLRSHVVRHGAGPLPTETPTLAPLIREHNRAHPFQGQVRYGWFDAVLARYALEVVGGMDRLVLTHADLLERDGMRAGVAYRHRGERLERLAPEPETDTLTRLLRAVEPQTSPLPVGDDAVKALADLLGRRIDLVSRGPTATDVADAAPLG